MSYNWEKIFKDKTNLELYNIYKGKTHLSGDAIEFAKKELECRNLDVNNLVTFIESVKGTNYEENLESYKNSVKSAGTGAQIGLVFFLVLFFSYFLNMYLGILEIFEPDTFIFLIFIVLLFTGIEFTIYNTQTKKLKKFIDKYGEKEQGQKKK